MNEQWINDLRQKMTDYEWPVPEVSWDEIDQAVAANKARKARLLWLRRMAAAAVVLLIAGVGYWSLMHNDAEPMQPTTASVSNQPQDENHALDSAALLSKEPVPVVLAKSSHTPNMTSTPVLESEPPSPISEAAPDTAKAITTTATNEKEQPQPVEEKKAKPADKIFPVIYPSDLHQRKNLDNRLTAKVYMSSTMAGRQVESFNIGSSSPFWNIENPMDSAQVDLFVHHRQPVRFGLSLRYRLNDRWSVESGLSYTCLSSDITTTVDGKTTVTEQRLNYIGLPLSISYDLWKSRRFGLYVSAGGVIEKSLNACPWQFSLNGAAGAEYKLTDFFSLYAEPGLGYYFKDGSITPTIYQDHPLNFNLSFGLRFNLK
jgi:hypothetical protein